MLINKGFLQSLIVPIALFMAVLVPVQPVLAAVAVGQTGGGDTSVDGVRVPSGTTLLSPATVESGANGAVLHLANGEVVALAPESTAVVASLEGGIQIAVEKGNLAYTDNSGQMETLSRTETILIAQQGQIQQGERIPPATAPGDEEEEDLCELQNWTASLWQTCTGTAPKDKSCNWDLLQVPQSEVPQYLEKTAVLACKDRNDLGLSCDCKKPAAIAWWIPVAAAAGGVALWQIIDDDDPEPASPTTP